MPRAEKIQEASKVRILLVDDHQMIRDGLTLLINHQPDLCVVGQASDGEQAVQQALALQPDVVVMDLTMPKLNGLQATQRIKAQRPHIKILALTVHEDASYLRQLTQASAEGYVLKRAAGEELIRAIRKVAAGGVYYDANLTGKALLKQWHSGAPATGEATAQLTQREEDVLTRIAQGYTNKEIAAQLDVGVKTVETYRARIAEKLGLHSRAELVQFALRQGWLRETV